MGFSFKRGPPGWLPLAFLAAAAAYLAKRWDDLPNRWVVHWGPAGNPNGWADRTWQGVYGPLIVGSLVWALLEAVSMGIQAQARRRPDMEVATEFSLPLLRWLSVALGVMFAFLGVDLPLGQPQPRTIIPLVLLMLVGGICAGIAHTYLVLARARREGTLILPPGYHGLYYANREDRRLFVPKHLGWGWTLNFSHPMAWPVLLLIVGMPLAIVAATLSFSH